MTFDHANFNFVLTHECNYRCPYCIQGHLQNDKNFLNFKMFTLIINKIFEMDFKSINISLSGGELSSDEKYLKYFEYVLKINEKYNKMVTIEFLSNFSVLPFYKKLLLIIDKYKNTKIEFLFSLHKNYVDNVTKTMNKITDYLIHAQKVKNIENVFIFLENYLKIPKDKTYYKNFEKPLNKLRKTYKFNIKLEQLRQFKDCPDSLTTSTLRRCNALYYTIEPSGKIQDLCRGKIFNFMNLKFIKNEIICSRHCPCSFLEREFTQILIGEIGEKLND